MYYAAVSFCCIWGRFGTVKAGARRWNCRETRCPTRAPNFPYHRLDCHIVILVLSTSYQWMAGAIPYADDIRGRSGAANAGGWCHMATMLLWLSYTKVHLTSVYHMSLLLLLQFNVYCYIIVGHGWLLYIQCYKLPPGWLLCNTSYMHQHPLRTMGALTFPIITSIAISCHSHHLYRLPMDGLCNASTNGIKGWLGSANASAWCHNGHDTTMIHTMYFAVAISLIKTPWWWCIPPIPTAYYWQMRTTTPFQYTLGTKFI